TLMTEEHQRMWPSHLKPPFLRAGWREDFKEWGSAAMAEVMMANAKSRVCRSFINCEISDRVRVWEVTICMGEFECGGGMVSHPDILAPLAALGAKWTD